MKKRDVLVIGSVNHDSFYTLPSRMRIGENMHALKYTTAMGGKGANQAVQCAKLSLQTTMFGCVGNDEYGRQIVSAMRGYGVHMENILVRNVPTGNASVWVYPDGEVQAALFGGANMTITKEDIDAIESLIENHKVVILQNEIPKDAIEYSASIARASDCFIIYNAAPAIKVSTDMFSNVDLLVVNEAEASYYSEIDIYDLDSADRAAKKLSKLFKKTVIITLGAQGSLLVQGRHTYHIPAKKVEVVETTGAGDSYVGALAYGVVRGLTLAKAADIATLAASITIKSTGAQPSMPKLEQLGQTPTH